jgi:thioredoxin reductase (NADPH)
VRVSKAGKVIELDREHMLALMQTDAELGDIMMRAFILRRVELVAAGMGDVVLIGSIHSVGTLRIKEFLTRNGHPYSNFMNIRLADIRSCYEEWREKGAGYLTEPKEHRFETRCYMRDPDGYIIEVGRSKNR